MERPRQGWVKVPYMLLLGEEIRRHANLKICEVRDDPDSLQVHMLVASPDLPASAVREPLLDCQVVIEKKPVATCQCCDRVEYETRVRIQGPNERQRLDQAYFLFLETTKTGTAGRVAFEAALHHFNETVKE